MIQTDFLSIIFCSIILLYACYSDIKTRTVSNKLWLLSIAVSMPLIIYNIFLFDMSYLIALVISISLTTILAYLFFRLGSFGGADAKSLICIAILIPTNHINSVFNPFPFAITTLINASIISLITLLLMFFYNLWNLEFNEFIKNLKMVFIGYKIHINTLTIKKHVWLLHSYNEDITNKKVIPKGVELNNKIIEQLKEYAIQSKLDKVWVTPKLPYMLFITSGFFISLFYGNLVIYIINYIFIS